MTRIELLNRRYAASASVARTGVQITAVADPVGARFNVAVRRLIMMVRDDGPGIWDDLVGASRALRWRLITQPQPIEFNPGLVQLAGEVAQQAQRLRGAVVDQELLDEVAAAALSLAEADPVTGSVLLRDCQEADVSDCVVLAASKPAQVTLDMWLKREGILVMTAGELEREQPKREQAYVVGPPRFYPSSIVTAPMTSWVGFLVPAWFGDRSVPGSAIAPYADGAIRVEARVFTVGETTEHEPDAPVEAESERVFLPQPAWGTRSSDDREPGADEVKARKLLLSGNLAMWLDDGDRIRSLDPLQPVGERVTYIEVANVQAGTYLLLRRGATERGVLYQAALDNLGPRGFEVATTQISWKQRLSDRLGLLGEDWVVKKLRAAGVKRAERARAWVEPNFIRPNSDRDIEALLVWLGIPIQPTFDNATLLRKSLYRVSAGIGKQLETAVSAANLTELEIAGHLSLDVETEGFRGLTATRVLGISPYTKVVARRDARVPFEDRSAQWLE